jgi:cation-transporting ATPase E
VNRTIWTFYETSNHGARWAAGVCDRAEGPAALITLITMALWVLASVARPYAWWKVALVGVMVVASALMFLTPLTRHVFLLDPTPDHTLTALACAAVGVVVIQLAWWTDRRWGRRASQAAGRAAS